MKLTRNGIKEREAWKKAGIDLPGYDVEAVTEKAKKKSQAGYISESEISSVYLSAVLQMVFWKREFLTEVSHV